MMTIRKFTRGSPVSAHRVCSVRVRSARAFLPAPAPAPAPNLPSETMDAESLREAFHRDGIVILDGVLQGTALESFREQVSRELTSPCIPPESGTPTGVSLSEPRTWPRKSARRVIEVVPPGVGEHWSSLRSSRALVDALDALLGPDAWELPDNQPHGGECAVRHWYCPVVFPESDGGLSASGDDAAAYRRGWRRGDVGKGANAWTEAETAELHRLRAIKGLSWEETAERLGTGRTPKQCRERHAPPWTPEQDAALMALYDELGPSWGQITHRVQPRRVCTKRQARERAAELLAARGEASASEAGVEARVGVEANAGIAATVPGADATALDSTTPRWEPVNRRRVRGKGWHVDIGPGFDTDWRRKLAGHPCQGAVALVLLSDWAPGGGGTAFIRGSHRWVAREIASREPDGVRHQELNAWVIRTVAEASASGRLPLAHDAEALRERSDRLGIVEQIVGRAGAVALLHPWLAHCGTTNLSDAPRLMANGMVRVTPEAFARDGGVRVLAGLADVPGKRRRADKDGEDDGATHAKAPTPNAEAPEHESPRPTREALTARATALAESAAHPARSAVPDASLPKVSIVIPVHNARPWLDECFASVMCQTYRGPMEVSAYDDASDDGSDEALRAWAPALRARGVATVTSGSRWARDATAGPPPPPGGIGHAKNAAVAQSSGEFLVFLDADDIMLPRRVEAQVALATRHPTALVGGCWRRHPAGSTEHYERWANALDDPRGLWLEQFREVTVQMPTWCVRRDVFDAVGGFAEAPPNSGEAEDLIFFHAHLDAHGPANVAAGRPSLARAGTPDDPVLLYRWSPDSGTSRVSRRRLLEIRVAAFERRVLSRPEWERFAVWGAGRDARAFVSQLSPACRARVTAMLDVDPKKCGATYANHRWDPPTEIPVVHFDAHRASGANVPVAVCVAKRRKGLGEEGELEKNVDTLGLVEGESLWYIM